MREPVVHFHLRHLVIEAGALGDAQASEANLVRSALAEALMQGPAVSVRSERRLTPAQHTAQAVSRAAWAHPAVDSVLQTQGIRSHDHRSANARSGHGE
jgi:protein-tyrosine-phosphatase